MATPKILVFCNSGTCDGSIEGGGQADRDRWHHFIAIAEDGECITGHLCSHHSFARNDMGLVEGGWKRDLYAAKYPAGFEVELVRADDPRLDVLFELNKQRGAESATAKETA